MNMHGEWLSGDTYYYWPNFGYTPRTFTDADFAKYAECPKFGFL